MADPNNALIYWSGGELDVMAVSKTTNSGLSWTRYSLVNPGYAYALAVDPANSSTVYAGGNPGAYKTTNSGASWNVCSSGLTGFVYDFAINPMTTSIIYAATPDGVFRSVNGGGNWANTGCTGVNAVLVDPDDPTIIYAGTNNGVYRSTSSGGTWVAMNDGLENLYVTSLGIYPTEYLYCGTEDAGMYRWAFEVGTAEDLGTEPVTGMSVFPNPASHKATISYSLAARTHVKISLYDVQGRLIICLADGMHDAGTHTAVIDIKSLDLESPTGVYFCRIEMPGVKEVEKIVVLR